MSGRYRLRRAVDLAQVVKQDVQEEIPAVLGVTKSGQQLVDVPNRPGYVYAQIRGNLSELVQAYNDQVSPVYGLQVLLIRDKVDKGRFRVKGRDLGKYQNWGSTAYLPKHGAQHSFDPDTPGGDITWIWGKQFMPLMAVPSGSNGGPNVIIYGSPYNIDGDWAFSGDTGTIDIAPTFNPTGSNARMVLVYLDAVGNPHITGSATYFSESLTGTSDIIPYVPTIDTVSNLPIAAIRLVSGTSIINWDNIYDFRPHFRMSLGGHIIQDDGVSQTARDYLNFVGAGFVVYDDGTTTVVSGTAALPALSPNRVLYTNNAGVISHNNYLKYFHDVNDDHMIVGGVGDIKNFWVGYNLSSVQDYAGSGSWNSPAAFFAYENKPLLHFFRGNNLESAPYIVANADILAEIGSYGFGSGTGYFTWGLTGYIRSRALGSYVNGFGSEWLFGATVSGSATSREALKLQAETAWFYKDTVHQNNGAEYFGSPQNTGTFRIINDFTNGFRVQNDWTGLGLWSTNIMIGALGNIRLGNSTGSYTNINIDGSQTMIGKARVRKEIRIPVSRQTLGSSAPTAANRDVGAAGSVKVPVLQFSKTLEQETYFEVHDQEDMDESANVEFHLMWFPGAGWTAGNYMWKIDYLVENPNATINTGTPSTISVDVTPTSANTAIESTFAPTIDANLDQTIWCRLYRDVANDNGDDVGEVRFIEVSYISNKLGEAT